MTTMPDSASRTEAAEQRPHTIRAGRVRVTGVSWWWLVTALAAALVIGLGTLEIVRELLEPLALLVLGISIATSLIPAVTWLERRRVSRAVAVLSVYLVLVLFIVLMGWLTIPTIVRQVRIASALIPDLLIRAEQWLEQWEQLNLESLVGSIASQLASASASLISLPLTVGTSLFDILVVVFISIYWLLLGPSMLRFLLTLFPVEQHERLTSLVENMGAAMGGYLRGAVINGAIVGVLVYIGLLIIGVDFALALALIAALLEVVPVIGPIISGAIIVSIAFLQSPPLALIVLIFIIAMQQVENNILVPNIMRSQTNISPLLGLLAVFAGGTMGGLLGAIIAIPVVAALRVFVLRVIAPAVRERTGALPEDIDAVPVSANPLPDDTRPVPEDTG